MSSLLCMRLSIYFYLCLYLSRTLASACALASVAQVASSAAALVAAATPLVLVAVCWPAVVVSALAWQG